MNGRSVHLKPTPKMEPPGSAPDVLAQTGGPALKKFRRNGQMAKSLPPPELTEEMLRRTRPAHPKPGQAKAPVEAWATPGKPLLQKSIAPGTQTQYGQTLGSTTKTLGQSGQWATAPPAKRGGGLELPPRQEHALSFQSFNGTTTGKNGDTGSNFAKTVNNSNFMKTAGPHQLAATKPPAVSFATSSNGSRPPLKASLKAPLGTKNRNLTSDLEGAYLDEGAAFGSYGVPDKLGYRADSHSGSNNNGQGSGGGNGAKLALPRLALSAEAKRANMPVGNLFDSPRAKGTLRSFLRHFMEEGGVRLKTDIDLGKHALATGEPISNAWIQELCVMQPDLKRLSLAEGSEVTDVGLWAIARHCPHIESLDLSKCSAISKVGLRSLSLRCQGLEELKFDHCTHVDDQSLRTIAAGCCNLRYLSLVNCTAVTDTGVSEVAKCCPQLTHLDLSGCSKIGEYGDTALQDLGRSCPLLTHLDMFGCTHVRDTGLAAVAQGCPNLHTLRLTGCHAVSDKAVEKLASHCAELVDLSLSGCPRIGNKNLASLARRCPHLTKLDLSDCHGVGSSGLQAVVSHCRRLKVLNLQRCAKLDDGACLVMAHAHQLEYLNLGGCPAVTGRGITEIAEHCTGLDSLDITGCTQISRRFLMELVGQMDFSQPATKWFGYEPRSDTEKLKAAKALHKRRHVAAVLMQAHMRAYLGKKRANERYREWVMAALLCKVQARVRGVLARSRWQKRRLAALTKRCATSVAAAMRGTMSRRRVAQIRSGVSDNRRNEVLAMLVQRTWRGYVDRAFVQCLRREAYQKSIAAAKYRARLELKARIVQGAWRRRQAKQNCDLLRALRDARNARIALELASCQQLQRVLRGHLGRVCFARVRHEYDLRLREWREAIVVQAAFRGMGGRRRVAYLRWLAAREWAIKCALVIQSAWRANRARYRADVTRSLRDLRRTQFAAAREIQRCWRGKLGRERAARRKLLMAELQQRERAAMTMCRVFRGHKGRERWEVAFQLKRLEKLAAPLYQREQWLLDDKAKVEARAEVVKEQLEDTVADAAALQEEMETMLTVTAKYWDTSRISGAPQRFLTEFLKIRLAEQLAELEAKCEELKDQYQEIVVQVRQRERELRQVRRELQPLTQGTAVKTKRDRTVRLRNKCRDEKAAAVTIQRCFRGHRLRAALFSWYRDYWTASLDDTTGETKYVNSWSGEVKWKQPLEMTLLPHLSKEYAPPVDEEEDGEEDDEDDEDEDEDEEEEIEEEDGGWAEIEGDDGAAEVGDYDAVAGDY